MSAIDLCTHPSFGVDCSVQRMAETEEASKEKPKWFRALIQIKCLECKMPFQFLGAPLGMSHSRPTMAVGGLTIHVPIHPADGSKFEPPAIDGFALLRKEKGSK